MAEDKEIENLPEDDLKVAKEIYAQEKDLKNHLYIKENSKINCFRFLRTQIISYRNEENPKEIEANSAIIKMIMENDIVFLNNNYENYQEIEHYFNKIAKKFDAIQIDEKKLSGMPVIKNTRIPISLVVACLKDEMTIQDICEEYRLTKRDIEAAMEYVIEILDVPYQEG